MKGKNDNQTARLKTISYIESDPAMSLPPATNLELAMTNSAFGYEYAVKALEEEGEFSIKAEQLKAEIENLKEVYFNARTMMHTLDAQRLHSFESALQVEKSLVFPKEQYMH